MTIRRFKDLFGKRVPINIGGYNEYSFQVMPQTPRIVCKDGTTISVQASKNHYCMPRDDKGPYTHVEVGYPSVDPPDTWNDYDDGGSGVYGYVPIELVLIYICRHGGIDYKETLGGLIE